MSNTTHSHSTTKGVGIGLLIQLSLSLLIMLGMPLPSAGAGGEALSPPPGNLRVELVDELDGHPVRHEAVYLKRLLPDGTLKHIQYKYTDARGLTGFQVDDLDSGAAYRLLVRPYNGGWVESATLTRPGTVRLGVGVLPVTVVSGSDGERLQDYRVVIKELLPDGQKGWSRSAITDASGQVIFDPPGLGAGREYILAAKSPLDGTWKKSGPIRTRGSRSFTVGNVPLNVTLVNGLTGTPIAGQKLVAREKLKDGTLRWVASHVTDSEGRAVFDLDQLGSGRVYDLQTLPYNGGWVRSGEITEPGDFTFRVGMLPVTVRDQASGRALAGKRLSIYEKTPDGRLHGLRTATTDSEGRVVFDAVGLDDGRVYLLKVRDPYGQGGQYYSGWITHSGAFQFAVEQDAYNRPDRTLPQVSISAPAEGSSVAVEGFRLNGWATDDQGLDRVILRVSSPRGTTEYRLDVNAAGYWEQQVGTSSAAAGEEVTVTVEAWDTSYNTATASGRYQVVVDGEPPRITIDPRGSGQEFPQGFLVSGTVVDDTGVSRLVATIHDQRKDTLVTREPLAVAADGRWNLVVHADEISSDSDVTVELNAIDAAGNRSGNTLLVHTMASELDAMRLVNRITFGATPELLERVRRLGPDAFLREQLNPENIDDSALEQELETRFAGMNSSYEPQQRQLVRAAHSKRQLLEVMTAFWDNHFNTDIRKSRISWELDENAAFREHALGYFRDLLQVSATSPAMLRYLENYNSRKEAPNENYARELMELHTLGVDGGYTQQDVEEVARVFTGWMIRDSAFYFSERRHDQGIKQVLGETLYPTGMDEGEAVLDMLAEHPSTARFICTKLLRLFVEDQPETADVDECAAVFSQSNGHIGTVVEHILRSPAFNRTARYHGKIKTPLEFYTGILRNLQAVPGERDLFRVLPDLGMALYRNPIPTGWAEQGDVWSSSSQLLQRLEISSRIAFEDPNPRYTYAELLPFLKSQGIRTAEGVVGALFQLLLGGDYSMLEWDTAMGVLTRDGLVPFDIEDEEAAQRVSSLLALVMSFPSYQLQ